MRSLPLACARPLRAGCERYRPGRRTGQSRLSTSSTTRSPVIHRLSSPVRGPGAAPPGRRGLSSGRDSPPPRRRGRGRPDRGGPDPAHASDRATASAGCSRRRRRCPSPRRSSWPGQGRRAYVRVDGRIDTEDEFEGPDHQPLVLRRVRLEAAPAAAGGPSRTTARSCRSRSTRASTRSRSTRTRWTRASSSCRASRSGRPRTSRTGSRPGPPPDDPGPGPDRPGVVRRARDRPRLPGPRRSPAPDAAGDAPPPGAPAARMTAGRSRPAGPDRPRARTRRCAILAADGRSRTRVRRRPDRGRRRARSSGRRVGRRRRSSPRRSIGGSSRASTRWSRPRSPPARSRAPEPAAIRAATARGPGWSARPGWRSSASRSIGILAVVATTVYVRLTAASNAARTGKDRLPATPEAAARTGA